MSAMIFSANLLTGANTKPSHSITSITLTKLNRIITDHTNIN